MQHLLIPPLASRQTTGLLPVLSLILGMLPGKVFDRMSKGIREAPGKALIGDLAAESGDRTEGAFGALLLLQPMHLLFIKMRTQSTINVFMGTCYISDQATHLHTSLEASQSAETASKWQGYDRITAEYHACDAVGLRQAMSTFGALVGATIAGLAFRASGQNYTTTFALATIPAAAALMLTISVSTPWPRCLAGSLSRGCMISVCRIAERN